MVNGGFEAGSAPWTSGGWVASAGGGFERSGLNVVSTGCVGAVCMTLGGDGELYQDVTTVPGQSYTFSFWYRTTGLSGPVELQALISNGAPTSGGSGICSGNCVFQTATATATYVNVAQTIVATSATTRITFLGRNDPEGLMIDDVSFVSVGGPVAAVPTMTEWAMILFGLVLAGGAAVMIQRRRLTA